MSLSLRTRTVRRLLESKAYRDAFVLEHIKNGIAFQIRTLREDREWTQGKLGELAGKPRNVISRLEDPNYGKFTLSTLLEIASAFDVGLMVKFVPYSRLTREYDDVSPKALSARSVTDKAEIQALMDWAAEDVEPITGQRQRISATHHVVAAGQRKIKKADSQATSIQGKFYFMNENVLSFAFHTDNTEGNVTSGKGSTGVVVQFSRPDDAGNQKIAA